MRATERQLAVAGTLARDHQARFLPRHGESASHRTPEYRVWVNLIGRCTNPADKDFPKWGGRGITVCPEWRESYERFLADVGRRPRAGLSLDRIDNSKGYEPGNVRWATPTEQGRNKRNNRVLTFQGESLCIAEWASRIGINRLTLGGRLLRGWSVEQALSTPLVSPEEATRRRVEARWKK